MSDSIDVHLTEISITSTNRWLDKTSHDYRSTSFDSDQNSNTSDYFFNGNGSTTGAKEPNRWTSVLITVICALIILGTIIGNLLVCAAVGITRKLRTPSNMLIVSLAISDLLVGCLDMPFAIMTGLMDKWILGQMMCDFWTSIDVFFCTASILNLCMISIDRYLVITKPFDYALKRTPFRMFLMIALVWIVSAIISIPPLFGWKKPLTDEICEVSQDKGYQFFATICAFYLPLIIMIVIYTRIYIVSSRMANNDVRFNMTTTSFQQRKNSCVNNEQAINTSSIFIKHRRESVQQSGICNRRVSINNGNGHSPTVLQKLVTSTQPLQPQKRRNRSNSFSQLMLRLNNRGRCASGRPHELKATRTLGVIMGAFVACWLPFFILALIKPFCSNETERWNCIPSWLSALFLWLGYTNSLLNPVIYARFNRDFRTPFKYILQCRCNNINSRLRSEDFTEQFGRLQFSRHSSLFPPPLPNSSPPAITPPPPPPLSPLINRAINSSCPQSLPLLHSTPELYESEFEEDANAIARQKSGFKNSYRRLSESDGQKRKNSFSVVIPLSERKSETEYTNIKKTSDNGLRPDSRAPVASASILQNNPVVICNYSSSKTIHPSNSVTCISSSPSPSLSSKVTSRPNNNLLRNDQSITGHSLSPISLRNDSFVTCSSSFPNLLLSNPVISSFPNLLLNDPVISSSSSQILSWNDSSPNLLRNDPSVICNSSSASTLRRIKADISNSSPTISKNHNNSLSTAIIARNSQQPYIIQSSF